MSQLHRYWKIKLVLGDCRSVVDIYVHSNTKNEALEKAMANQPADTMVIRCEEMNCQIP